MDLINALRLEGVDTVCKRCVLSVKRHETLPNLVLFKYEQTQSSFNDPVVRDARGIVLDENNDWKPVVFPYTKFFNYHESLAHVLDWTKPVKVTEKSDGSLMTIYFHQGQWYVSTQGKPEAGGKLATFKSGEPKLSNEEWEKVPTYAQAFWTIWKNEGYLLPEGEDTKFCFMFELNLIRNVIVIHHKADAILLHGCRNLETFQEMDPTPFALKYNWKQVKSYGSRAQICSGYFSSWEAFLPSVLDLGLNSCVDCFSSLEQVIDASKKLNGTEQEGFICCDVNFNRVKIKSPMYVTISLLRGDVFTTTGLDKRRLLQIVRMNEGEEFLSYFPQFTEAYQEQLNRFNALVQHVEKTYALFKDIKDDKEYATAVKKDCPQSLVSLIFKLRKGTSVRDFFAKIEIRLLEEAYLHPFEGGEQVLDAFREAASNKKSKKQNTVPKK